MPVRESATLKRRVGFVFVGMLALAVNLGAAPSPRTMSPVPEVIRAPVDRDVYPGISIAVGRPKAPLVAAAYGVADIERKQPMTPQTPLRMASVSKSITAVAVLMLEQRGALSLGAHVSAYVPQFRRGSAITVRQLLDHTSGIPGHAHGDPIIHGDGPISRDTFFQKLNATPLYAAPGTKYDYANENYYLLALIVERTSHMRFADFLAREIFSPAGMHATYSDDGRNNDRLAMGYVHRTTADPYIECPGPDWSNVLGGGGIISTPSDIARFDLALLSGKYIDERRRTLMFTPSVSIGSGLSYALGWFDYPHDLIQHQGDFTTATSINAIYPDGTVVVEAANGAILAPEFDRTYFANELQNMYGTIPFPRGKNSPASMLDAIAPFASCDQLNAIIFPEWKR